MKLTLVLGVVLLSSFLFASCSLSDDTTFQEVDDSYCLQYNGTDSSHNNLDIDNAENETSTKLIEFNLKFPFVSNMGFGFLQDVYSNIDFIADFINVDKEQCKQLIDNFYRLIMGEAPIYVREDMLDRATSQDLYIHELIHYFAPHSFIYYFLDFNGDGNPDLGIRHNSPASNVYVIKYNAEEDRFTLWYSIIATSEIFIGPQRVSWSGGSLIVDFSLLGVDGSIETYIIFSIEEFAIDDEDVRLNLVNIPYPFENHNIPEYLVSQIVDSWVGDYMLRVTDEQFDVLFRDLLFARTSLLLGGFEGRIPSHGHTFGELFGGGNN